MSSAAVSMPGAPSEGASANEHLLAAYSRTARPDLIDHVVRANQPLVHYVLKRFDYADEPYEDLVQVGNLGLLKAAQAFDPSRGVRFSTYATSMIEGELRHHLRDSVLLRQPRWARRLYRQVQQTTDELQWSLGRAPQMEEVAQAMNIESASLAEVVNCGRRIHLFAWDEEGDDEAPSIDRHVIQSRHYESFSLPIEDKVALAAAVERLSDFQRSLVELLFYREFTQREVAEALGCTTRKVGTELQHALVRLRELMGKRVF
jgi:RNA polymerase sigma-B factor